MLSPDKVRDEAKKKEAENYRFRTYLKMHAEEKDLDQRFLRLHNELFAEYDCSKCRNCCKMHKGILEEQDIKHAKKVLGMEKEQLIDQYLNFNEIANNLLRICTLCISSRKESKVVESIGQVENKE
ncbi:MAG TPA: hypothetical protein VN258_00625 [Mobilitalea sp.]|nr:hypothetical protein [Mobilitalea sp.]